MSAGNNPIILPIKPQIPTYCQSSWQAAIAARPENVRRARFCQNIARLRKYLKSVLSDNIKILRPDLELELVPYESKVAPHLTQKMPDVLHNGQLQILFAMLFRQLQKLQVILILHRQLCLVPVFFRNGLVEICLAFQILLIAPSLDMMDQYIPGPAIFLGLSI